MSSDLKTLELAKELVKRPSITPDDAGCQHLLAERLEKLGFEIEFMNCGDVHNLWARKGTDSPLLTYVGHTDVVPTGNELDWLYSPFSATVADGFLYGRGAADMKGSVAAIVTACERFFASQPTVQGSFAILITSDEEGQAINGTRHVMDKLCERSETIDWCLVGEPTSEDELGDTLKIGRRGSLEGNIIVRGKQGHVAYPHLADNPIHRVGLLIARLAALNWDDGNQYFPNTTLQISNVHSGVGVSNVIPGELQMTMNFRYSPSSKVEDLVSQVEGICQDLELNYESTWNPSADSYYTKNKEFIRIVSNAARNVLEVNPKLSTAGGTSDGRFVAQSGAQVVEFGPLNSTIHKVNECVSVNDLERLSATYEQILKDSLFSEQF